MAVTREVRDFIEILAARTGRGTAQRQRGARRRVYLARMVRFDDFQVPMRQRARRIAQQPRQHRDAETEVGRVQHRNFRGRRVETPALRCIDAGGAADQRHPVRFAIPQRGVEAFRRTEVDHDIELPRSTPVVAVRNLRSQRETRVVAKQRLQRATHAAVGTGKAKLDRFRHGVASG